MTVSLFRSNNIKRFVALLLVLSLLPAGPVMVFAQKGSGEKQDQKALSSKKKKLQNDIAAVDKQLKQTRKNKTLSMNQLFTINKKIEMREELISTITSEIDGLDQEIAENNASVQALQQQVDQLKKEYASMIVYAYRNRNAYQRMMFVFAAKGFSQAYNRVKYIKQVNSSRLQKAEMIAARQQELNLRVQNLEQQKAEKQSLLGINEGEKQQLAGEKTEKEKTFLDLSTKENELKADLERKKKQALEIDKAIAAILEAERIRIEKEQKAREERARIEREKLAKAAKDKKKNGTKPATGGTGSSATASNGTRPGNTDPKTVTNPDPDPPVNNLGLTPEEQLISNNFEGNHGKLPWPVVQGSITLGYGRHPHPVLEKVEVNNNGVDITTSRDAAVRSIYDGEVTGISEVPGVGKIVIVRHGQYLSMYVRLSEVYVKMGDKVKTKQPLGKVNFDEDDGTSIIHLEIWKSGIGKLNPQEWLAKSS